MFEKLFETLGRGPYNISHKSLERCKKLANDYGKWKYTILRERSKWGEQRNTYCTESDCNLEMKNEKVKLTGGNFITS